MTTQLPNLARTLCIVGAHTPFGSSCVRLATSLGLEVLAVVPFGSNGPEGVRTVMADFSDPQRVRNAVAAVHPSVDDLLIAPTDDPLAKGTPQNASQLLAAFMTAQVSLATTMALLVSGSGSVTLVGSARCTPNSQLDDWFRKGIAQVTPTLAPRRVSLAIPGSSDSAATWLLSVFA